MTRAHHHTQAETTLVVCAEAKVESKRSRNKKNTDRLVYIYERPNTENLVRCAQRSEVVCVARVIGISMCM